jgi:serine/threonine-protein kinase RsbW
VDATPQDAAASGGTPGDVVQLRLPAAGAYLSVLRTATAGLAARLHFTLDEIEDLRIAVDEASAMLLTSAVPGADLECEFVLSPDVVKVSVTVLTLDGTEPSRDTFSWTVLTALAGEVSSRVDADGRVTIELHKRREVFDPASGDAGTVGRLGGPGAHRPGNAVPPDTAAAGTVGTP